MRYPIAHGFGQSTHRGDYSLQPEIQYNEAEYVVLAGEGYEISTIDFHRP